jgi:hypothetical protein
MNEVNKLGFARETKGIEFKHDFNKKNPFILYYFKKIQIMTSPRNTYVWFKITRSNFIIIILKKHKAQI